MRKLTLFILMALTLPNQPFAAVTAEYDWDSQKGPLNFMTVGRMIPKEFYHAYIANNPTVLEEIKKIGKVGLEKIPDSINLGGSTARNSRHTIVKYYLDDSSGMGKLPTKNYSFFRSFIHDLASQDLTDYLKDLKRRVEAGEDVFQQAEKKEAEDKFRVDEEDLRLIKQRQERLVAERRREEEKKRDEAQRRERFRLAPSAPTVRWRYSGRYKTPDEIERERQDAEIARLLAEEERRQEERERNGEEYARRLQAQFEEEERKRRQSQAEIDRLSREAALKLQAEWGAQPVASGGGGGGASTDQRINRAADDLLRRFPLYTDLFRNGLRVQGRSILCTHDWKQIVANNSDVFNAQELTDYLKSRNFEAFLNNRGNQTYNKINAHLITKPWEQAAGDHNETEGGGGGGGARLGSDIQGLSETEEKLFHSLYTQENSTDQERILIQRGCSAGESWKFKDIVLYGIKDSDGKPIASPTEWGKWFFTGDGSLYLSNAMAEYVLSDPGFKESIKDKTVQEVQEIIEEKGEEEF